MTILNLTKKHWIGRKVLSRLEDEVRKELNIDDDDVDTKASFNYFRIQRENKHWHIKCNVDFEVVR